ncbi:MAG: hypothetical protein KAU01_04825 [Candidatus Cloacimonetes bacterium]|nr:hypothetical protein [Candidatus Cloacimonadota bacterium]
MTAVGIITPIIYTELKNQSEIEIKLENSVTVITKPTNIDNLEIYYKKQLINELKKGIFRITNKSNISLLKSDFVNPIKIALSKDAKIISFEVEEKHPKNLSSELKVDSSQHSLSVEFELLNPSDYLILGILYTGNISDIQTTARIKGVKDIIYREIDEKVDVFPFLIVLIAIIFSSIFLIPVNNEKKDSYTSLKMLEEGGFDKLNKEELLGAIPSVLHYLTENELNSIRIKINSINSNDDIEDRDKIKKSIDLVTSKLKNVFILNKRATMIINILRIIGVIFLIIWLTTFGNNVYTQLLG